ncbi:TniB family NTP-binding protein [Acinetobacter sp. SFB]|uniref:TniB family NTP-binding protein n=1 Tax=Acinetobacter sp. SFB TaxID=1805634 RepID=UPI0009D6BE8C|nr:TniB family NTP-binding protein [Acinetobacter sp. SFB]
MSYKTICSKRENQQNILQQIKDAFETTANIASTIHGQRKIYQGSFGRRTSLFPSQKCCGAIPLESRLELAHAIRLEQDPNITNYRSQALKILITDEQYCYPDFLVQTKENLYEVHEIKPSIASLSTDDLNRFTILSDLLHSINITFKLIDHIDLPSEPEISQLLYSRAIVGTYINMYPPSAATTLAVIKEMVTRPTLGLPGGIPSIIIPDNGVEFKNNSLARVCDQLKITLTPSQVGTPNNKPHIERFFNTLTHGILQKLPGTVKSLAITMLRELGDPTYENGYGTTEYLTSRLIYLLAQCETKLIFLDEFHHLFERKPTSTRMNRTTGNWLKTLVNRTGISFCLVGLPEFVPLLQVDSQIARRFPFIYQLNPLTVDPSNNSRSIFLFLSEVARILNKQNITFLPALDSQLIGMQIQLATKGFHSYVMSLIRESIAHALNDNRQIINPNDFSYAWKLGITSYISKQNKNPFEMNYSQIISLMK